MSETKSRKKKSAEAQISKDVVTRISRENFERLNAFKSPVTNNKGKARAMTLNECLEGLLTAVEALKDSETVYLFADEVFHDPAEARGAAIMHAARFKGEEITKPLIAVVIGEDEI